MSSTSAPRGYSALAVLRIFRKYDNRLYAYYLMHDYAFTAQSHGANPPELEARIRAITIGPF